MDYGSGKSPLDERVDKKVKILDLLSVLKFTANLYCICLGIDLLYIKADAVQILGLSRL